VWLLGMSLGKHRDMLAHAANGSEFLLSANSPRPAKESRISPNHARLLNAEGAAPVASGSAPQRDFRFAGARHDEAKHS
jgi:hypothetical protein